MILYYIIVISQREKCSYYLKSRVLQQYFIKRKKKIIERKEICGSTSEIEQIFTLSLSSLSEFLSISGHFSYYSLNTRMHSGHTLTETVMCCNVYGFCSLLAWVQIFTKCLQDLGQVILNLCLNLFICELETISTSLSCFKLSKLLEKYLACR